jgi:peptidoglycan/LPS O-acetylase OafA/YrhL
MTVQQDVIARERFLASGDEAGTAPDDRRFRPDVEGLRAVAILLVVLYHANVPHLTGGYVGVDVFFVISGFVITGLLLRERGGTGRTSILDFYARRCRRILPAATLVILATVVATYIVLGVVTGNATADDGRWAAAFLANFHFESIGTNYLSIHRPPSPLQNYWSLSVEEQFYLVYPTLFLVVASAKRLATLRTRLVLALSVVIVGSYWLSVAQTASNPSLAYFSPLTRAWELALGGLVATTTIWLRRIPGSAAALLTWGGLGAIAYGAFAFNAQTAYPGSLVAIPVVGAALIIAGGTAVPRGGVEPLLATTPLQWIGRRSYALYLWHWPILIIAAERAGRTSLPVGESLVLVLAALGLSAASYSFLENPIRHWRLTSKRSVLGGIALVLATILVLSLCILDQSASNNQNRVVPVANEQILLREVAASASVTHVPNSIQPALAIAPGDWAVNASCTAQGGASEHICYLGDTRSDRLMVVYGDSLAAMWLPAFETIATSAHLKLVLLSKDFCPAEPVTIYNARVPSTVDTPCEQWHVWATRWINEHDPAVLVISQYSGYERPGSGGQPPQGFSAAQWQDGLAALFASVDVPNLQTIYLGGTPAFAQSTPQCLAAHLTDVQYCGSPVEHAVPLYKPIEQAAAHAAGVEYIDPTPWFCTEVCSPIIENHLVYLDGLHITATWAEYLWHVLADAVDIPVVNRSQPPSKQ